MNDQSKTMETITKEHYMQSVRHLASLGLLHLHGPSSLVHPYSLFSVRFDPNYLSNIIDHFVTYDALRKWSKTWLE